MAFNRRTFLKQMSLTGSALAATPFLGTSAVDEGVLEMLQKPSATPSENEDFWSWVQQSYRASANIVNLNNGGVSPQPKVVEDAFFKYTRLSNEAPSLYMWRTLGKSRRFMREKIAGFAGVSAETIAINRNTTEALDTIINGLPLQKGDEVILSKYDYPNMYGAWLQRAKRDGIVIKYADFPMPCTDTSQIVQAFERLVTKKTRIIHVTHVINWTGQILPVRKIADMAHQRGVEVVCDGAHSFAHLEYAIPELDCDYFGTSLHKWLCAPYGTGLLYMKKEHIEKVHSPFPEWKGKTDVIEKFENLGTRSFAAEAAVGNALNFHLTIGSKRKQERLQELKSYWFNAVSNLDRVTPFTSPEAEFSCALAAIGIDGVTGGELSATLMNDYGIHTTNVKIEAVDGVRVTPHIYTKVNDLDRLVEAIEKIVKR